MVSPRPQHLPHLHTMGEAGDSWEVSPVPDLPQELPAHSEVLSMLMRAHTSHLHTHTHYTHTEVLEDARLHFHDSCSYCLLPVKSNQPKI